MNRSLDWLRQAQRDIEAAKVGAKSGFHEWACFLAQQGGEKAVKAVLESLRLIGFGHSITKLLERLENEIDVPNELLEAAKILDKFYIPTRYPNNFDEGAPMDYYTEKDSKEAIESAKRIVEFARRIIQG